MKPFEIKPGIHWIGALHPDLKAFDIILQTKNGTTYNSYLIQDEKTAIIDTVKGKFTEQYLEHISQLVDFDRIDYIIIQHNEPDHTGALSELINKAKNAQIVCANVATKYVANILNQDMDVLAVKNNNTLSLGKKTLQFQTAPYLHWPDTMMTHLVEDNILFPCDVFASHFCDSRMFDDLITRDFWTDYKYYFDAIMRPYKKNVRNGLKKIEPLTIDMIAPSHGPILRNDVNKYINAYKEWSAPLPVNSPPKALLYFASAHGNTGIMAREVEKGLASLGIDVKVYDAEGLNFDGHLDKIEAADAVLFGSPTINNDAVKPVWDIINSLATIDIKGKIAGSFGSIGWNGEAIKLLDDRLNAKKFKVPFEGLQAVLVPGDEELLACREFGKNIGIEILNNQ
jgi:NADH oxidase (H2O-forming)